MDTNFNFTDVKIKKGLNKVVGKTVNPIRKRRNNLKFDCSVTKRCIILQA